MSDEHTTPTKDLTEGVPEQITTLAAEAGIDTSVCEFCEEPLVQEPWRRGRDGCGAHERCLRFHL